MTPDPIVNISLKSLFWQFLKIGSYSFGGYVALVAVVEKELVQHQKVIRNDDVLEGLTLASFLPGPVAVNTVVYIGHLLHGVKGAMVCMTGVLLPTFLLVTGFSYLYFHEDFAAFFNPYISFIMPVVLAIVVDVAIRMAGKNIKEISMGLIAFATVAISLIWSSAWAVPLVLICAGALGLILYRKEESENHVHDSNYPAQLLSDFRSVIIALAIAIFLTLAVGWVTASNISILTHISSVFSGMSLTLFGGGYVIIPIIEQVLVNELHWIDLSEFNAAISISQVTPGPILISAAFIGFKMAGIAGALAGTLAIFMPTGILMILLSGMHQSVKNSAVFQAVIKGLKSAVIGLIAVAAISIGSKELDGWISIVVFLVSMAGFTFTKVHPILVILATLILGIIIL